MYHCQLPKINLIARLATLILKSQLIYGCVKVIHKGEKLTLERICAKSCSFTATRVKSVASVRVNISIVHYIHVGLLPAGKYCICSPLSLMLSALRVHCLLLTLWELCYFYTLSDTRNNLFRF